MGSKKQQFVTLVTPSGHKQAFTLQHAERLLGMGPVWNGGWEVDKDEKYYYDENNGLRLKTGKANSAKAKQTADDSESISNAEAPQVSH